MMSISSPAGRRLARAKAAYDEARLAYIHADVSEEQAACTRLVDAKVEKEAAADAVADELITHGFDDMDGED